MSAIGRGLGAAGRALGDVNKHLLTDLPMGGLGGAAAGAAAVGSVLGGLGQNFADRLTNEPLRREVENRWAQVRATGNPVDRSMRRRALLQAMEANRMALAKMEPHLYAEILAGQRLPVGAVVLGGQPDTGLLEETLRGMTFGGLGEGGEEMGGELTGL